MHHKLVTVHPEDAQQRVAEVVNKYGLLAVPVVKYENGIILGIVTVDDIIYSLITERGKINPYFCSHIVSGEVGGDDEKFVHSFLGLFFAVMGPGIVTAFADNDAGGIATYATAGATYGYDLLFTLLIASICLGIRTSRRPLSSWVLEAGPCSRPSGGRHAGTDFALDLLPRRQERSCIRDRGHRHLSLSCGSAGGSEKLQRRLSGCALPSAQKSTDGIGSS